MTLLILAIVVGALATLSNGQSSRAYLFEERLTEATQLFSGLEGIKSYFRNSTNPLAHSILETFEQECFYMEEPNLPASPARRPFIVIEGNHQNSREVIGVRLACMLGGRYLIHPAPCLVKYLDVVPRNTLIRRAFYVLSLYATSFNVKIHLSLGRAVVLNGYWLDQLSFAVVKSSVGLEMPAASNPVFNSPHGLLQPDLIFYLNLPDDLFQKPVTTRSPLSWKTRALALYSSLTGRYPIVIEDLKGVFRLSTDAVYQRVFENLTSVRDISAKKGQDYDYPNPSN